MSRSAARTRAAVSRTWSGGLWDAREAAPPDTLSAVMASTVKVSRLLHDLLTFQDRKQPRAWEAHKPRPQLHC